MVVGAILKMDRPFRAANIVDLTGLDRQLVSYHLRKLLDDGYIAKAGLVWTIENKAALFDSLTELTERVETTKMKTSKLMITSEAADSMNDIADTAINYKLLGFEEGRLIKAEMLERIDRTTAQLKNLRKWLNNTERNQKTAAKMLKGRDKDHDEILKSLVGFYGITPTMGFQEFDNAVRDKIKVVLEADDE